ncbi:MAG TPA: glycerol-3-phosphate 1-O-acyltransferase PlsY [Sulfurovum sp.]|jgi:glycerol-3-phosphate acyltransferase PlsY|nr:MAG: acyl-phosphate--glycerol-3-phosphate O-acyltransferase [Sulfurovum sp. 35-42-20]OYY54967.1 MAG: acyl-phosphate--glycerol-3-phosphate O-acyltransferase [Sulfurovum sp. 28-43-6]OYZ26786.1 MAG: acyl-phosphate--glycerol-3-phosphate O-acyltransferase [Sulfurovum sp. 16-42-52]OYZ50539.1 MAG: acyl-phosphate--glycerol-3-phosphate O-acyltransferase [Sulfurovum sp. 24-42-9]OZA46702.1 MAG: acyl-phosphate--glycerol-3-phosphate O-acyltransferase [Sulfurovum sp. 17-42-90]OZA61035.1 MAG: acyl-phospha
MDFLLNQNILLYLAAYIIAGIPFGYLLAKKYAGVNIKESGSGNIGATNVLRVVKEKDAKLAKKLGAVTLFLDAIKGVLVIVVAKVLGTPESVLWTIAVLAVVGHCFSVFLSFEGGKGVATGFGVLAVMMPLPALVAIIVWLIAAKGLKISSLSSLIGLLAFIITSYVLYPEVPGIGSHAPIWIIALIIFYKHIPNIVRLFKKEEGTV